jgi:hypothetical protein
MEYPRQRGEGLDGLNMGKILSGNIYSGSRPSKGKIPVPVEQDIWL